MPHLPKLFAAVTLAFGFALGLGQAKATPPLPGAVASARTAAEQALPVEKVHRRYRYWGWGPRYNYWYWGPRYYWPYYYYRPYPYYRYRYWYGPGYRYWW